MRSRTDSVEGIDAAADAIRENAESLDDPATLDRLVERLGDERFVLFGEATHGTSEFYRLRAQLSARLIRDHDFSFVAVEGDWTDCYEVNRFVKNRDGAAASAKAVLDGYDRWPTWMWANWEVVEFVDWLAGYNEGRPEAERAGFYGMDVYSLFESMDEVVSYLEREDPEALEAALDATRCFEPYGEDAREYARSTRMVPKDCEDEVVELLAELRRGGTEHGAEDPDEYFNAEQNAVVARNAEEYYRTMIRSSSESWNVRDRHMVETLDRLADHHGPDSKAIVWAHNTHVGDARATDMADRGEVNVGQLVREAHDDVAVVGFGTHRGEVVAADEWGAGMEPMRLPTAREGSHEDAFHRAGTGDALLSLDEDSERGPLVDERGHRAVGVVYHPEREWGNYVPTVLPRRYDEFVHVEETTALHPLHMEPHGDTEPETYPWGV